MRTQAALSWTLFGFCAVLLGLTSRSPAERAVQGVLLTPDGGGRYVVTEIGQGLVPTAVNIHGQVVGYTHTNPYIAYGINDIGQVVGESFPEPYNLGRAFLWSSAEGMQDLGTLGGSGASAHSINNSGAVAGTSVLPNSDRLEPFVWTRSEAMRWLGSLSEAQAIITWPETSITQTRLLAQVQRLMVPTILLCGMKRQVCSI